MRVIRLCTKLARQRSLKLETRFSIELVKVKRPNEIRYVSGLVSLLRDINEVEAEGGTRCSASNVSRNRCPPR
jgi:hypothetical protein